jgi:tetratricopeptide (TPR) repeat protein
MIFKACNILVALFLISLFFIAGQNVIQTFRVADMAALNNLAPKPIGYFWELNTRRAALDRNKIHIYADYYEHLIQVFPGLWDAYSMLGYCYHYLGDDPKAVKYLTIAIKGYPDYFWDHYNLAAIYINESRYQEALNELHTALNLPAITSLKRTFSSQFVYLPLLEPGDKEALAYSAKHLDEVYKSSFVIAQIINQAQNNKETYDMMKKIKPELYAF